MRDYTLPEKLFDESNWDWCRRAAESIPAEALMRAVVAYLMRPRRRRRVEAWSIIGKITGHGSGVSSAIVERFAPESDGAGEGGDADG